MSGARRRCVTLASAGGLPARERGGREKRAERARARGAFRRIIEDDASTMQPTLLSPVHAGIYIQPARRPPGQPRASNGRRIAGKRGGAPSPINIDARVYDERA